MYKINRLFHTINGDFMKDMMSSPVIVGKLNHTLAEIASIMKQHDIGFLPIAKENKIVGVITDRDLVIEALANRAAANTTVENYITHRIISIDIHKDINDVLENMRNYQVKRILVTDAQKIVGVIATSDLLYHYHDSQSLIKTLKEIDQIRVSTTQDNLEIDSFYL